MGNNIVADAGGSGRAVGGCPVWMRGHRWPASLCLPYWKLVCPCQTLHCAQKVTGVAASGTTNLSDDPSYADYKVGLYSYFV